MIDFFIACYFWRFVWIIIRYHKVKCIGCSFPISRVRKESAELGKKTLPGQPVYGLEHSNGGLITFPGGVPLLDKAGVFIGSIGVSGGSVDEDQQVGRAAAAALAEA